MPDYNSFVYDLGALYDPKVISSKCYAHFRMSFSCWNGANFGFDWLRNGDSEECVAVDIPYSDIVGANYKKGTNELETNGNIWNCDFRKDEKAYKRLSYTYFPPAVLPIIPIKDDYYAVPVLSLYPFNAHGIRVTASLVLHIYIKETVEEMYLDYDKKLFDIKCDSPLPVAKSNQRYTVSLDIKCNEGFDRDQFINVISVDKKGRKNLSGMLRVWRNSFIYQKKLSIGVYFVDFKGCPPMTSKIIDDHMKMIKEKLYFLWHALIRPEVNRLKWSENDIEPLGKFSYNGDSNVLYDHKIKNVFLKKIEKLKKEPYDCIILYFNKPFVSKKVSNGYWGNPAFTNGKCVLLSSSAIKEIESTTTIHEILHSRGLMHTFDNNEKFTFKSKATDNLLDYSDIRVNWFHWQWQKATNGLPIDK